MSAYGTETSAKKQEEEGRCQEPPITQEDR